MKEFFDRIPKKVWAILAGAVALIVVIAMVITLIPGAVTPQAETTDVTTDMGTTTSRNIEIEWPTTTATNADGTPVTTTTPVPTNPDGYVLETQPDGTVVTNTDGAEVVATNAEGNAYTVPQNVQPTTFVADPDVPYTTEAKPNTTTTVPDLKMPVATAAATGNTSKTQITTRAPANITYPNTDYTTMATVPGAPTHPNDVYVPGNRDLSVNTRFPNTPAYEYGTYDTAAIQAEVKAYAEAWGLIWEPELAIGAGAGNEYSTWIYHNGVDNQTLREFFLWGVIDTVMETDHNYIYVCFKPDPEDPGDYLFYFISIKA